MDVKAEIGRVYENLENDRVDKAAMICLRISRHFKDAFYFAVFLREMHPNTREFARLFMEEAGHLTEEAKKFIFNHSLEFWLDTHTSDFSTGTNEKGEEMNVLTFGVCEIDAQLVQCERHLSDMKVPSGMGEYDTAALTDEYSARKNQIRVKMTALQQTKQRIKTRCLGYASRIERELDSQIMSRSFLAQVQVEVNNYFKAHSEEVYNKLQKAAELLDVKHSEDASLLLVEIRRAIKAAADFFYKPRSDTVLCSDGKERRLGEEEYLNRLEEYISNILTKSSSRDLLLAEFTYLSCFARRLNDVASKGVHSEVTGHEAKQGLVGLYMFLYNVISRVEKVAS